MVRRALLLGLLTIASTHAQETKFGEWQKAEAAVLRPDAMPAWDDFAIGSVSVVKLPDKWAMIYEGVALSEDGRTQGFGKAESPDGISWKKRSENPVFVPGDEEWEAGSGPSVARWGKAWWMSYVVERTLTFEEKSPQDFDARPSEIHLARSGDGLSWGHVAKLTNLGIKPSAETALRPCIYADASKLHMWWIAPGDNEKAALFHAVSGDGQDWTRPNRQPASEIDSRPICCARVSAAGDSYILIYVAYDEKAGESRVVTKVSQNARTWTAGGPPEFPLGPHWQHATPSIVFIKEGARLFYCEPMGKNSWRHPRDPFRGSVLRTAFCPKNPPR